MYYKYSLCSFLGDIHFTIKKKKKTDNIFVVPLKYLIFFPTKIRLTLARVTHVVAELYGRIRLGLGLAATILH